MGRPGSCASTGRSSGSTWAATRWWPGSARCATTHRRPGPELSTEDGPKVIAVSADAVWVADHTGAILRIDPATNRVTGKLQVFRGSQVLSLAEGEGALWATTRNGQKAELARIDPAA